MNQPTHTSLTFWKIAASLSRLLLWLAMAAWVLFAVAWIVLHGVIVPRIGDFRAEMEIQASKALGVPVRIGAVAATSVGIIPSFELKDVALLDGAGRTALKLPRILAAISPSSLLQLSFEQLYIDQPELEIRRALDGKIFVAGLDFSKQDSTSGDALDWFFSQPEFVIRNGTLRWVDEQPNGAMGVPPPLALSQVDFVSRNPFNKHLLRLDATPQPEWGNRLSLRGVFTQSLLSPDKGKWRDWVGQIYADFSKVDVSQLSRYVKFSSQFGRGVGAVRAWTSVAKGAWVSSTADVTLAQVDATLGAGLEPLALQSMSGRLAGKQIKQGFEFSTQNLQFQTRDGLRWPGGNVFFSQTESVGTVLGQGEFRADKLDLAAISLIANRLPLGAATHAKLTSFAPQGVIQTVAATWRGSLDAPSAFAAKGQVTGLQFASLHSAVKLGTGADVHEDIGRPGVSGAKVDFDVNMAGGKAKVLVENGVVDVPGVFDEPRVPVKQLSADVLWTVTPAKKTTANAEDQIEVKVSNLTLDNADAQGRGQLTWRTSDPATALSKNRFPGQLDLQANLTRADAARVWRYLPSGIPKSARDYVREAVVEGASNDVDFKIKGDMSEMPSKNPKLGEFRIVAKVNNAKVAYVPRSLQSKDELPWPELQKLVGELVVDRTSLTVKSTSAEIVGLPHVAITQAVVAIPDLKSTTVSVNTQGKGALVEVLGYVNGSPLKHMTNQVLSQTAVNGNGDFKLELSLPIADINRSRVVGSVNFLGNDVRITPTTPLLGQAKGAVSFTEKGFNIQGGQALMLGGDVRFEGGSVPTTVATAPTSVVIRGQGSASAVGLQQAGDLSFIPALAKHATGSAAYSAELRFKHGQSEVLVQSSLVGMGLNLPAPMNKLPAASWPLRYDNSLIEKSLQAERDGQVRPKDQIHVTIDKLAEVKLTRDVSGAEPRLIQGGISVGLDAGESMPEPASGVAANINVAYLDIDQWTNVLTAMVGGNGSGAGAKAGATGARADAKSAADDYIPSVVALRAKELIVQGRKFENIVIGGSREGATWRANMEARQLSGYVEYRQPTSVGGSGRVYARLARLAVAEAQAKEVEKILDEQPTSIPALDLVVEDFELKGRKLGRVEVEAVNLSAIARRGVEAAREWRLNRFNVTLPEAKFTATGLWAEPAKSNGEGAARAAPEQRSTSLDFKLDIADSGQLLNRFGLKGVVLGGKGKLEGQVAWRGSPLSMNYPSMTGQFNVNIEKGQFLKVDPGVGKLLSVLSMQSIMKRLTFDFRDVFSDGFAFDFVRGDVAIERGLASTNNIQMSGVNAVVLIDGKSDIAQETQDLRVVIAPEVNAGVASLLVASAINPAIGLGTFLAQLFLRQPLIEAATREMQVKGTWSEPLITEVKRTVKAADKALEKKQ